MVDAASLSLDVSWGKEQIRVADIPRQLVDEPTEAQVAAVVAAGRANAGTWLPAPAWTAVARAAAQPGALEAQLRSTPEDPTGLLMKERVEGAALYSGVTRVLMSELYPGIQPRTGMLFAEVPDPQVEGITHEGRPSALVRYTYKDIDHLRNHVWNTVNTTLGINQYTTSVLSRSVTRNLIVHPVEYAFEDGTEPFYALTVRDGITRLASAWAVLAGSGADAAETASLATEHLVARHTPVHLGRVGWRQQLREEFAKEVQGDLPGLRTAQIAQTFVVPAQIAVGVESYRERALSAEDVFDDAVRSVLASIHVEFKQWDMAAQNVEVITRALKRIIQEDDPRWDMTELQAVYGFSVGRLKSAQLPEHFGTEGARPPGNALWRAVYLLSAFAGPALQESLKDQAKAIKGGQRMSNKGYGDLLAPIIDLPWRSGKKAVMKQARNAWSNGGVLTAMVCSEWAPQPVEDFTELVGPAMEGDVDSLCTLAVAGGVALIADKLLTRNVGSSLGSSREKGGVPFRMDVYKVIEGLAKSGNELGLWLLATAANTFREDDVPQNAVPRLSLTGGDRGQKPYAYFKLDLAQSDRVARDASGVPELLYEWDIVAAADPERYEKLLALQERILSSVDANEPESGTGPTASTNSGDEDTDSSQESGAGPVAGESGPILVSPPTAVPPSQQAAVERGVLRQSVQGARDVLDRLLTLEPVVSESSPVVPLDQLEELHQLLIGMMTDMENLRRRTNGESEPEEPETD